MFEQRYYIHLLSAFVRGKLSDSHAGHSLLDKELSAIDGEEAERLLSLGQEAGLSLHKFKRKDGLPRVNQVLGLMHGLQVSRLLDIGSGRGAFLWPLVDTFPWLDVVSVDILPNRVADINALERGGWPRLRGEEKDITATGFADNEFDVVTMLEVLEHIPACEAALREVCRIARRAVILSVPSKPDDNPEHIHLFTKARLTEMFRDNGIERVRFHSVLNHIVLLAILEP